MSGARGPSDSSSRSTNTIRKSPRAAEAYLADVLDAIERLGTFPMSGRSFDQRHRVLVVRNHLVIYRHERGDTKVLLSAILDGRRDIAALMRRLN